MAAATVTGRKEGVPAEEHVQLEALDGYTYVTSLSRVFGTKITLQEDVDSYINCSISGRTITINAAGVTAATKDMFLTVYGEK